MKELPIILTELPGEFFTAESLGTLAGATTIVYLICGAIQTSFNYNPKWLALLISIVMSLLGAYLAKYNSGHEAEKYIVAFINGFLIYGTVAGTNAIFGNPKPADTTPNPITLKLRTTRKFNSLWFS
jgi:hypothetical protein